MRIGIVGAGNMGGALAKLWVKAGHEVAISFGRDKNKLERLVNALGGNAQAVAPAEACELGEIILLAVPLDALDHAIASIGSAASGKVVVTTVSPYAADFTGRTNGMTSRVGDTSAAERISELLPGAVVVEAFNLTFADMLAIEPPFAAGSRSVPVCGDDAAAKKMVAELALDAGLDPIDMGQLSAARALEQMATAWVQLAAVADIFPAAAITIHRSER